MNPCPCGFAGDPSRECRCTPQQMARYRDRLSGPLRDRLDLTVEVPALPLDVLDAGDARGESSAEVRARVVAARERQRERYAARRHPHQRGADAGADGAALRARSRAALRLLRRPRREAVAERARLRPRAQGRAHDRRSGRRASASAPMHVAEALQFRVEQCNFRGMTFDQAGDFCFRAGAWPCDTVSGLERGRSALSPYSAYRIPSHREAMRARRYTVVIADRTSGVVRRVDRQPLRPAVDRRRSCSCFRCSSASAQVERADRNRAARPANALLQVENGSYRAATGELTTQIQSLEGVIDDLGARASLDPAQARAMQKLPAIVKARAAGGNAAAERGLSEHRLARRSSSPEDTFGVLRDRAAGAREPAALRAARRRAARRAGRRDAVDLAGARLAHRHFGGRSDPFTGEPGFHQGLDISTERASRCSRRPTARSSRRRTPATTAT